MQLRKEIGREEYTYKEGDRFANGDIDIFYDGMITLTKHRSGIVSILFNTQHRWVSYSIRRCPEAHAVQHAPLGR